MPQNMPAPVVQWSTNVADAGRWTARFKAGHLTRSFDCHSFSRKGEFLAMDVDYANNKGSYVITRTTPEMSFSTEDIITWDDVRREDGQETLGLLSQISPDGGKGGTAQPLRGASRNGRSNYFPKYSPDGRWIIFCQASNCMLLQPDSELFIIPAEGGEARRLQCDLGRMNSWHSWSPNGHWLVFTSKAHSDYTQLYLTRISEAGEASPPVWLAHMAELGRVANIPEFVDLAPGAILRIHEKFLDDHSYVRAAMEFVRAGEAGKAIEKYRSALLLNSNNVTAHQMMG